jgi:hypothetical protein
MMDTLTTSGRAIRVLLTLLGGALLLAGTLWGSDDHFPFGPFRMYATVNPPNDLVPVTRVEGVDSTGTIVALTEGNTGIRLAELEAQQKRYGTDPVLLQELAHAYGNRNPAAPELVEVRIVIRSYVIRDSRPTGRYSERTLMRWRAS